MEIKYDKIGVGYNRTRKPDTFLTQRMLQHLSPNQDGIYLDIGCGTGNYTKEFQKRGFNFIGIDPSEKMLEKARFENNLVDWRLGSAENTRLQSNSVDGIIGSLTIHHWTNLQDGFLELNRVLKPNGKIVIFTATPEQMEGYWLNHYFPKVLSDAMIQMPSFEVIKTAMNFGGFKITSTDKYFIQPDLEDKFLYCGKHNPELYFDTQIRSGISSFASLTNQDEVEQGLTKLRADIDSGKIEGIIENYENNHGDYMYIIGEKL
ncbi:class I SAM-dependent methyltransferase [Croceitalea marina]|uniref:Class I SAM-dependent methyltransferase n=1 Tax=Croceitalea marina TaxID=1775166 RepID=A0ABW5N4X9_9FLAO